MTNVLGQSRINSLSNLSQLNGDENGPKAKESLTNLSKKLQHIEELEETVIGLEYNVG